ncbi:MAG: outer membrane protein assembly factor BamA [Thermodesulfobacteriota bacterium]|nr:outer membrane protein assembly factor BamA [Thermodesulfobacteriota bacterium]
MNHLAFKFVLVFICLLSLSAVTLADDLEISVIDTKLNDIVSDIPCVDISEDAPLQLTYNKEGSVFHVMDNAGISYSAASIKDAVDGYLRLRGVCVVHEIVIKGTKRISTDAILFRLLSTKGDILHKSVIRHDIENIYSMGYFESCDASFEDDTLIFNVKEYPVIMEVKVEGNKKINDEKILDSVGLKRFNILNTRILKTSIDRIKGLYREKGYYNVDVTSSKEEIEGGIVLTFHVDENKRLFVKKVLFDGNKHVSSRKLRKIMKTKTRWPLGLFSHAGSYIDSDIDTDLLRVEQYYGDQGYLDAKVGRPQVDIREKDGIYITIPVEEGLLYHVGGIDITGDLIRPKEELIKIFGLSLGAVMSKSEIHLGLERIRDIYMDKGYAYARIKPVTKVEDTTVNLRLDIKKGSPVHIDEIHIRGNTKTRDKVVRRELKLQETDLFSSTAIKRSKDKLNRLGYFSRVAIDPVPSKDGKINLDIEVEENPTGALSFGVAYSSADKLMTTVDVSENNLMGLGLKTKFNMEYGKKRKSYSIEFVEPWLFDHPISLGVKLYDRERELLYYTKSSKGGSINVSYPLFEEVRHYISYDYEDVSRLEDIDPSYEYLLDPDIKDGWTTSSITNTLYRDTTNDYYRPTRGSNVSASIEYAGLGGDYHFTRTTAKAAKFFPIYKDKVALMLKARWGTINGAEGDKVPLYERFSLGGLSSIRGFKYGEVGPRDDVGNVVGGRRMVIFNTEITVPIGGVPGLSGLVFFDAGNAYNESIDLTYLKKSYGGGFRWVTPMGPLRLEYGKVISPKDYESSGGWEFSIGTFF